MLDERGREVSSIELGDALTVFLNEDSEMSTDVYSCNSLQLPRQNELQHQHQHQQDLSRPSGPGRWQPAHMHCGAFFVPVCEYYYHVDCEGECLEVDPCLHGW